MLRDEDGNLAEMPLTATVLQARGGSVRAQGTRSPPRRTQIGAEAGVGVAAYFQVVRTLALFFFGVACTGA